MRRPPQAKLDVLLAALAKGVRPHAAVKEARLRPATVMRLRRTDLAFAAAYVTAAYRSTYPDRPPVEQVCELAAAFLSPGERAELARAVAGWVEPVPERRAA